MFQWQFKYDGLAHVKISRLWFGVHVTWHDLNNKNAGESVGMVVLHPVDSVKTPVGMVWMVDLHPVDSAKTPVGTVCSVDLPRSIW